MNSRQRKVLLWFAAAAALLLLFPPHAYGPRGAGHRFIFAGGHEGAMVAAVPLMGMLIGLAAVFGALFFAMAGPERVAQPGVRTVAQKVSGGTIRLAHGVALLIAATAVFSLIRSDFTAVAPQTASDSSHGSPVQQLEQKPGGRFWWDDAPVVEQKEGATARQRVSDEEVFGLEVHQTSRGTKPMVWFIVSLFMVPITVAIRVLNKRVIPAGWRSDALFNAKRWWDL